MAIVPAAIKNMLSTAKKSRHDSHTDQYNRIFMVILLLISSIIMGIVWFRYSADCMVSPAVAMDKVIISKSCWSQGFYYYKELRDEMRHTGFFGIPLDISKDGIYEYTNKTENNKAEIELCGITNRFRKRVEGRRCRPMEKVYFLQYQWIPFIVASLSILFYLPYVMFNIINTDVISLKNTIESDNAETEHIVKQYFNSRVYSPPMNILRIVSNILVKILYLVVNLIALLGLDNLFNGEYVSYGNDWLKWSRVKNITSFDYRGKENFTRPGNLLLPTFGYCDLYESGLDIIHFNLNKHKFVCELAQNVLYQYCLIVIWFALVFGIVISIVGLLLLLVNYAMEFLGMKNRGPWTKRNYESLSFRQLEYLELIRNHDIILHDAVMEQLGHGNLSSVPMNSRYPEKGQDEENVPLYPLAPEEQLA